MARRMKVFGWTDHIGEVAGKHGQARVIMAATTQKAVAEKMGVSSTQRLFCFCETGNRREIQVAKAEPGEVFWAPRNDWQAVFRHWPNPPNELPSSDERPAKGDGRTLGKILFELLEVQDTKNNTKAAELAEQLGTLAFQMGYNPGVRYTIHYNRYHYYFTVIPLPHDRYSCKITPAEFPDWS